MKWTVLLPVPTYDHFSKKLAARIKAVNDKIQQLELSRTNVLRMGQEQAEKHLADVDFDNLVGIPGVKMAAVTCLQAEVKLREAMAEALTDAESEHREAHDAATDRLEQLKLDVRGRLEGIGYVWLESPGRILPVWIEMHPDVFTSRQEAMALGAIVNDRSHAKANGAALERVSATLRGLLASATNL